MDTTLTIIIASGILAIVIGVFFRMMILSIKSVETTIEKTSFKYSDEHFTLLGAILKTYNREKINNEVKADTAKLTSNHYRLLAEYFLTIIFNTSDLLIETHNPKIVDQELIKVWKALSPHTENQNLTLKNRKMYEFDFDHMRKYIAKK